MYFITFKSFSLHVLYYFHMTIFFLFHLGKHNILFYSVILMKMNEKMKISKQISVRKPKQIQTIENIHNNMSVLSFTTQTIAKLFIFKLRTAESGALNKEKKNCHMHASPQKYLKCAVRTTGHRKRFKKEVQWCKNGKTVTTSCSDVTHFFVRMCLYFWRMVHGRPNNRWYLFLRNIVTV